MPADTDTWAQYPCFIATNEFPFVINTETGFCARITENGFVPWKGPVRASRSDASKDAVSHLVKVHLKDALDFVQNYLIQHHPSISVLDLLTQFPVRKVRICGAVCDHLSHEKRVVTAQWFCACSQECDDCSKKLGTTDAVSYCNICHQKGKDRFHGNRTAFCSSCAAKRRTKNAQLFDSIETLTHSLRYSARFYFFY